jgi:membrane protein implicated in regulation of membrane protease activity
MPDWLVWLIAAGVLAAAEVTTLTFVLAMFAGGALAGSITAGVGGSLFVQVVVAIVATVALLGGLRPVVKRHLMRDPTLATNSERLVGEEAVVLSEVNAHDGRVRLMGGEWSARSYDKSQVLPAGTVVRVMKINGATAEVLYEDPYLTK